MINVKFYFLRYSNVLIRRSYICLFIAYINSNRIYFQRLSSYKFQSMVFDIHWFSFCSNCLPLGCSTFINNNFCNLSYISQCYSKVERNFFDQKFLIILWDFFSKKICSSRNIYLVFFIFIIFSYNESLLNSITCCT
jgi:hypothetical protein